MVSEKELSHFVDLKVLTDRFPRPAFNRLYNALVAALKHLEPSHRGRVGFGFPEFSAGRLGRVIRVFGNPGSLRDLLQYPSFLELIESDDFKVVSLEKVADHTIRGYVSYSRDRRYDRRSPEGKLRPNNHVDYIHVQLGGSAYSLVIRQRLHSKHRPGLFSPMGLSKASKPSKASPTIPLI